MGLALPMGLRLPTGLRMPMELRLPMGVGSRRDGVLEARVIRRGFYPHRLVSLSVRAEWTAGLEQHAVWRMRLFALGWGHSQITFMLLVAT